MNKAQYRVRVGDDALRELILAAIEAYAVPEPPQKGRRARKQLETFGLLWGYERTLGEDQFFFVQGASVELHARRDRSWVEPNEQSFDLKRRCVEAMFPHAGWIGTFHSHPYSSLKEVKEQNGYEFSDEDLQGAVAYAPEWWSLGYRVDLVCTVCKLERVRGTEWAQLRWNVLQMDVGEYRAWLSASVIQPDPRNPGCFTVSPNKRSPVVLEVPYVTGGAYVPDRLQI